MAMARATTSTAEVKPRTDRQGILEPCSASPTVTGSVAGRSLEVLGGVHPFQLHVGLEHLAYELEERGLWLPAQHSLRLGRITAQLVDFGRPHVRLVDHHMPAPLEP